MSHGGVTPLTSPVLFAELPASTRHSYSSSTNRSSYSVPWITPLPQLGGEVRAARTPLREARLAVRGWGSGGGGGWARTALRSARLAVGVWGSSCGVAWTSWAYPR